MFIRNKNENLTNIILWASNSKVLISIWFKSLQIWLFYGLESNSIVRNFLSILYDLIMILSGYKFSLLLKARGIRKGKLCYFLRGMKRYTKMSSGYVQQGIIFWGPKQPFLVSDKITEKKLEQFEFSYMMLHMQNMIQQMWLKPRMNHQ